MRGAGTGQRLALITALAVVAAPAGATAARPDFAAARTRAATVVARMTLDEKLRYVAGSPASSVLTATPGVDAVARLGVPRLAFSDGPNGVGNGVRGVTAFPAALSVAAAWDRPLARRYGRALADEVRGKGRNYVAAPTVNVVRTPKWGRVPETFGEDPYLSGAVAVEEVRGLQERHVIAQVKHLAVNDQEERRLGEPVALSDAIDARVSDRALHETYLEPFRMTFRDGGAASVMCSYNRLDGRYACQDPALLGALRTQLGFHGFVGPDALLAVRDSVAAAQAGLDNFSLGSLGAVTGKPDVQTLGTAVTDGRLTLARLDAMATNVLTATYAVGVTSPHPPRPEVSTAAHRALATAIAARAAVLLRNRRAVLPLTGRARRLAVIGYDAGPGTQTAEFGSPSVRGGKARSPLASIRARAGARRVTYAKGTLGVVALPTLPTARLTPDTGAGHGLSATYFPRTDFSGTPLLRRVDSTIDVASAADLRGAGSVRWTGTFTPAVTGRQRFSLGLSGIAALFLDDRRVTRGDTEAFRSPPSFGSAPDNTFHAVVRLTAGVPVKVRVDYSRDSVPPSAPFVPEVHLGYAPPDDLISRAAAVARRADVAIVFAGDVSGETMDRDTLALPGDQDQLIAAVAKANPRTVVVLHTAGPVLTPWRSRVAGILEDWYPGQQSGPAIASVLFGDAAPGGRLPLTFPASASQGPATRKAEFPGVGGVADHDEESFVGYRFYDRARQRPAFAFGFGLAYTTFRLGAPRVAAARGGYDVRVPVTNTGRRTGRAVVQLYVGFPALAHEPARQLKAFAAVVVQPGATRIARLRLDRERLQVYDPRRGRYAVPTGRFTLRIGTSSRDLPRTATVRVTR